MKRLLRRFDAGDLYYSPLRPTLPELLREFAMQPGELSRAQRADIERTADIIDELQTERQRLLDAESDIEKVAKQVWRACTQEMEPGFVISDDELDSDWLSLMIESERETWRKLARHIVHILTEMEP